MRTVSPKHPKGEEPPRTLGDDLRLLRRIFLTGYGYFVDGRRIRKEFYEKQRLKGKVYIDEIDWI